MDGQRRPRWIYGVGQEPDYRFSLANERTYLAWIRTSLALLAAGVALGVVDLGISSGIQKGLAVTMVTLSLVGAPTAWLRWARAERAMRRADRLPPLRFGAVWAIGLMAVAGVLVVKL